MPNEGLDGGWAQPAHSGWRQLTNNRLGKESSNVLVGSSFWLFSPPLGVQSANRYPWGSSLPLHFPLAQSQQLMPNANCSAGLGSGGKPLWRRRVRPWPRPSVDSGVRCLSTFAFMVEMAAESVEAFFHPICSVPPPPCFPQPFHHLLRI